MHLSTRHLLSLSAVLVLACTCLSTPLSDDSAAWQCEHLPDQECGFLKELWVKINGTSCDPGNSTHNNCWGSHPDPKTWGVGLVISESYHVKALDFRGAVKGGYYLPESIGTLSQLLSLNLEETPLSGTIPASIGDVQTLEYLNLDNTGIGGALPPSLNNLEKLWHLSAFETGLGGQLPKLGNLTGLTMFNFGRCQFTGGLDNLCGMGNPMVTIGLDQQINSGLAGTIPECFGRYHGLVDLEHNNLHGTIPNTLGHFTELGLHRNQLTGTIPASLSADWLWLHRNKLSGSVPPSVTRNITSLTLNLNQLTGTLPPVNFNRMANSTNIDISYNLIEYLSNATALEAALVSTHSQCNMAVNPVRCPLPKFFQGYCALSCITP